MVNVFNKKYSIHCGLAVLVLVSLACNISINTKSNKTATGSNPTEKVVVLPTESLATVTPSEAVVEVPTIAVPTKSIPPTATKKPAAKTPTRTIPPPTNTAIPLVRQSTQAAPTAEASTANGDITITAATGNLFVRRGPSTTYNIVAGFSKGVTTKAVGRNEKNDWLAIEIPLAKGAIGWISLKTGYTELHGNLADLPLYPFDEPKPAYVQNCTLHDMTTRPGQWNLPAKTTQKVNPGEYQFLDMSTGQNVVMDATLKEGNTVYIKKDGSGVSHSCP
jgi:hypothetical protein